MAGPLAQMIRAKYPGSYDDLSDEQIEQAITAKFPGTYDDLIEPPQRPEQPPTPDHPHARTARAVGSALKGAWNVASAIPGAMYDFAADVAPYDAQGNPKLPFGHTATALINAHRNVGAGALEAFNKGDYLTAARKGAWAVIPAVGPAIDMSTDKMMQGQIAEGIGEIGANALLTAAPMAPKGTFTRGPIIRPALNPREAAAVSFGRQRNIPVDAGTATGSNVVKTIQEKAASTYGGARTAEAMQARQGEALARVSGELMDDAAPRPTSPVMAGERVRDVLTKQIQNEHAKATAAYGKLRQLEQQATPDMVRPRNTGAGASDFVDMQLAIDLRQPRQALRPIYDQLIRKRELTGQLMGAEGRAAVALDALMKGPDFAPLSMVDAALGDIKALARGAEMPELRTSGQGIAAQAVRQLDALVRARANRAGPEILRALEEGRAATKQKYVVADVLDILSGEPGKVFRQLTERKDAGVERLKAVLRLAPKEMPNVGRAFLEDLFQQATGEGGWAHSDRLFADWQKLGTETKRMLFPKKGQIEALDNFFLLQKRIKEVKNPSGTARMMTATNLLAGIPGWIISKMLMTPRGVKWLTEASTASRSPVPAARTLAITNITRAAQSAGVPLEAIPALGADSPIAQRQPIGTRR